MRNFAFLKVYFFVCRFLWKRRKGSKTNKENCVWADSILNQLQFGRVNRFDVYEVRFFGANSF